MVMEIQDQIHLGDRKMAHTFRSCSKFRHFYDRVTLTSLCLALLRKDLRWQKWLGPTLQQSSLINQSTRSLRGQPIRPFYASV
jgi:hypothetical protein